MALLQFMSQGPKSLSFMSRILGAQTRSGFQWHAGNLLLDSYNLMNYSPQAIFSYC